MRRLSGAVSVASSSSALPHGEAMASAAPCRYREGSRVQMVTNEREKGKQRWVKADVYRIDESSGRTAVYMREVGGHREEFKVMVPHTEATALTNANPQPPMVWDDSKKAPAGFGDDHLASVISFMTARELSALAPLLKQWGQVRKGAFQQHTHIDIDCTPDGDRQFWESITPEEAFELGKRLINLTALSLVQPRYERFCCLDIMTSIVEGHVAGRREAREKEGQQHMAEGSLETIKFSSSITTTSTRPPPCYLPPPFAPPPTLPSLRAVTGAVQEHSVLAERGWKMPALECVDQEEWTTSELGRFIKSSSSLKQVGGHLRDGQWATVFAHIPMAAPGQSGPLRQLERIGVIKHGIETARLRDVLTLRGCLKSLKRLDVEVPAFAETTALAALLAFDDLINVCCVSPDVPITVKGAEWVPFELSLFYADTFPPRPSPFIKVAIQEAARQASHVVYRLSQHDLTHPIVNPSQAAVDIAKCLSFDYVGYVTVENADGFVPPPDSGSPVPDIINRLQHFPRARQLRVYSGLGAAAGRLLAEKMPLKVGTVAFGSNVGAEDRRGVLEALGAGRQVAEVCVGDDLWGAVSFTQGGPFGGRGSNSLPAISDIEMYLEVLDELEPAGAAELVSSGLTSLLNAGVRGLGRVRLWLEVHGDVGDAIWQVVPGDTSIGDFTIHHGRYAGEIVLEATRGS
ncbi:unnamed protein product [Vitrella brassicaformis CCMP3155]|uniref:Uncharacterized protein n=1 Tax=Vitrella brassicaformis (strain CCMP3155) TaxID=1169540 RepID=A0A0G4GK55_VITBC|nr:unnamed protein product [Vitrella brassicaformis CCMP3155]|eukprot:CEM30277.1 unnamed protein product [Vitrella brassicaformis CCMP3155]